MIANGPSTTYGILANADLPYPSVTLSDGRTVELDSAGFGLHRASPNRADREKVMSTFFNAIGKFGGTFGSTLDTQV